MNLTGKIFKGFSFKMLIPVILKKRLILLILWSMAILKSDLFKVWVWTECFWSMSSTFYTCSTHFVLLIYFLTSKNAWFSDIFRGYGKSPVERINHPCMFLTIKRWQDYLRFLKSAARIFKKNRLTSYVSKFERTY